MVSNYKNFLAQCFVAVVFALLSTYSYASVQVSLDRPVVYVGESFTLTITTDTRQSDMPDLSLLEKDFIVQGTGSSQQTQMINGVFSSSTAWNISLQAKKSGQFHIPSLRVGKELTNPMQVTVTDPPVASAAADGQHIFIETEIAQADEPVYLQQQISYTVRLVFDQPLLEGGLSDPAPENALVQQLEKNNRYKSQRNGKPYTVIERRYAIFPEKSGELVIPPLRFNGRFASNNKSGRRSSRVDPTFQRFFGGDPFANAFDKGRAVTVQSKSQKIDVLPRPTSYSSQHWLPAADLKLADSWQELPPEFTVGEPASRTITIQAQGLLATLLPKLDDEKITGVNRYPEKPETETRTDGSWVFGISKQSVTYIPTKAGELIIPEIEVKWWDTQQGLERTTTLPKWRIDVLPGKNPPPASMSDSETNTEANPKESTVQNEAQKADNDDADSSDESNSKAGTVDKKYSPYWIIGALLLVGLLLVWWRKKNSAEIFADESKLVTKKDYEKRLQVLQQKLSEACKGNDKKLAADAILAMAACMRPDHPTKTLPALAEQVEQGSEELIELDRLLYATDNQQWDGAVFLECFRDGLQLVETKSSEHHGLKPLYPQY